MWSNRKGRILKSNIGKRLQFDCILIAPILFAAGVQNQVSRLSLFSAA